MQNDLRAHHICDSLLLSSALHHLLLSRGEERMSEDWVCSSAVFVGLDLVVLELLPGVLFGVFGISMGSADSKWFMCFLVAIEVYRLYRNMIEV